jgi:hypothetical protein
MYEEIVLDNVPEWLQKDIVTTCHEVPVAGGGSGTEVAHFYSPRLIRWAVESWLRGVPGDADPSALQRALLVALADPRAFRAYLRLPDAFCDAYLEELANLNKRRSELVDMKRLLSSRSSFRPWTSSRVMRTALCVVAAIAVVHALI